MTPISKTFGLWVKQSSIISFAFHERLGIKSIANSHFYEYGSMHESFTLNPCSTSLFGKLGPKYSWIPTHFYPHN